MCECDENTFSPLDDSQPDINSPLVETASAFPSGDEKSMFLSLFNIIKFYVLNSFRVFFIINMAI